MAQPSRSKKAWDYTLILLVFAVTGTTASIFPKWIMPWTGIESGTALYVVAYILLITPIYQVLLLGYAFLFGKFNYFYAKQKKLLHWMLRPFRRKSSKGRSKEQDKSKEDASTPVKEASS
jgi:hypothetical protein